MYMLKYFSVSETNILLMINYILSGITLFLLFILTNIFDFYCLFLIIVLMQQNRIIKIIFNVSN